MATFEIKTKRTMNVQGEYVDAGLSVQISSMFANPFDEVDKIHKVISNLSVYFERFMLNRTAAYISVVLNPLIII